ncbi:hypothetical protein ACGLWX_07295 [Halomonas sp. HMF6819]|uniref:hypothetical protein n=1 Tax=unclassified Halomonas TaxID=2609666 RepID=UPI002076A99B|nr:MULTISPECIES: hypothetical protein [unclassified Halomonas]
MIETIAELESAKAACQKKVNRSSSLSAGAAIIPIPGVDIGSDVAILLRLIPQINERFGLTPEQIDDLDTQSKVMVMTAISNVGSKMAGKYITRKLIINLLQKMGFKIAAKGTSKFVPVIGSAVAGTISYTAMKYMGTKHIEECYQIALETLEQKQALREPIDITPEPIEAPNEPR